ncbi:hypothetical protein EMIHUDRAFT_360772 [Emiliania huxleyi CCMP1516]|uniref:Uncharacterized protein n=2 Tax=Emiliania huxleyi TaxID=2903 RepID=A0A0D3KYM7_EMIH1|nr:hypothetical protein EMIHUDRAFT_360772 [Emiliania huxleyi CCMP1516]EOD40862.1 hypothetical protein EMIHUDRAFT_360772 [Emiliania huxleyi CCMP1516]|eukprot:XP_005793291.1 hypothetical protein EMIHUDRAFT_360772 [Emiliania huxleyi CCMP1516]
MRLHWLAPLQPCWLASLPTVLLHSHSARSLHWLAPRSLQPRRSASSLSAGRSVQ